jgi:AraC-like DNA-binding protein
VGYRERIPHRALQPFVDRFWTITPDPAVRAAPRCVLPDGCIDVMVDLADPGLLVVGTMTRALSVEAGALACLAAVRFRPGGAVPFLRIAAHELTDRSVEVGQLGLGWLEAAPLREPRDPAVVVGALERLLLERLAAVAAPDPLVAHAVRALFGPAPPSVEALARQVGWSRQHLRRVFRDQVGVGTKTLGRVARLQRAVDRLQRQRIGLAAAAAGLGYFDQAHMTRDFRDLVGVSPVEVRGGAGSIFPIRSLLEEA